MFIEVTRNCNRNVALLKLDEVGSQSSGRDVLIAACNKFRVKPAKSRLFHNGIEIGPSDKLADRSKVWLVGESEVYQGPAAEYFQEESDVKSRVTIVDGGDVWIDPEAIEQVHNTVRTSSHDILRAVGMPDLHHGPTGVAILARRPLPKLPGYDIGCGMALFRTRIPASLTRDAVSRRMARMDLDIGDDPTDPFMGTIGGGNHFAELLVVDPDVPMTEEVLPLLDPRFAVLLIHSGSRGHGERVFAAHSNGSDPDGYMLEHMGLVDWARRNRAAIALRFLRQFSSSRPSDTDASEPRETSGEKGFKMAGGGSDEDVGVVGGVDSGDSLEALVDIAHNWIEALPDGTFLHRKGAAPARGGALSLLPGSRATASYVLACADDPGGCGHLASLAHGSGRRLSRAVARRHADSDATRGGTVVCGDRALLAEEGAHAYKDVDAVAACMTARGMCRVAARLLPIATYKTRAPAS